MDDDEFQAIWDNLERLRHEIVRVLDPTRLFDELRSQRVLDLEDCEEIDCKSKYPTMTQRAGKFLDVLMRKGPVAYNAFCEIIERRHPHLYKIITGNESSALLEEEVPLSNDTDAPDTAQIIADLAKKCNILSKEKSELQDRVRTLVSRERELSKENYKLKRKNDLNQYQKLLNKKLKNTLREFEEKLHQVTEDKCDAVTRALNYQQEKELAQERLHKALLETEECKRRLNRAEGDCKFERSKSKRLISELKEKPNNEVVEGLKKEVQLLKTELNQHRSNQKVRQSMLLDDNERIAILECEREEARNELKQTVDLLFSARQECHAAEEKRAELSIRVQQLEKDHGILLNDCETYRKRKEELWDQLKEREKERNQAIRERDRALQDCAVKASERDDYFGKFYRLQEEHDTLEQQLRMLKQQNSPGELFGSESDGSRTHSQQISGDYDTDSKFNLPDDDDDEAEDKVFQDTDLTLPRNFRKRSQRVLKRSTSEEVFHTPFNYSVFEGFKEWTSTEDILSYQHPLSDSCRVHAPTSVHRKVESRRIFSERTGTASGIFQLSDSSSDENQKAIRRNVCCRKKAFVRRSQSCTELTRTLEEMVPNFSDSTSCEARSSINTQNTGETQSLRTTDSQSATSDINNPYPITGQNYDVLVFGSSLLTDVIIGGGNNTGIFIQSVKSQLQPTKNEINVGDQLMKITGNVAGKHCIESLVGYTLEQAHNFLEKAHGWVKLSLRRSHVKNEDVNNRAGDDSFFVRTNFTNGPVRGSRFTMTFEPGDILHVINTAHNGVIGNWYAEKVQDDNRPSEQGTIPNYHKGYEMFVKQTDMQICGPKRTPSDSSYSSSGCLPMIEVNPSFRTKKSKSVREKRTIQKLGEHATLPYIFVDGIKVSDCRPLLMVGAEGLVRLIQKQLCLSDITKDIFETCATEDIVCVEEELYKAEEETNDVVDSIREGNLFRCITVANIKAVMEKNKHCLCYVDDIIKAVAKLHAVNIYPILVLLRLLNPNERDPLAVGILGDQHVDKMRKRLLQVDEIEESLYLTHPKMYATMTVNGVDRLSIDKIVRSIASMVQKEQSNDPNVWVEREGKEKLQS